MFGVSRIGLTCNEGLLCLPSVDAVLSGDIGRCQRPPLPTLCVNDPSACPAGTTCSLNFICLSTNTCLEEAVQSFDVVGQTSDIFDTSTYFLEKTTNFLANTALVSADLNFQSAQAAGQEFVDGVGDFVEGVGGAVGSIFGFRQGEVYYPNSPEVVVESMRRTFSDGDFARFKNFFRDSFKKATSLAGDVLSCLGGPDYGIDIGKRQLQVQVQLPEIKPILYTGVQVEVELPGINGQGIIGLGM